MKLHPAERGYSYVLFLWVLAIVVLAVSAFTFYKVYSGSSLAKHKSPLSSDKLNDQHTGK